VSEIIGYVFGSAGFLAGIVTFMKSRSEVRKLNADGTAVLLTASTAVGAELHDQLTEVWAQLRAMQAEQRAQGSLLRDHEKWDREVFNQLEKVGVTVSPPPPLYVEGK
jgi:hypothetical protein